MRFRYRLQALLDDAHERERGAAAEVGLARAEVAAEYVSLARLDSRAQAVRAELHAHAAGVGGTLLRAAYFEFELIDAARERRRVSLAGAEGKLARTQAALGAVARERDALERHRERKWRRFEDTRALQEAAQFDESNAARTGFA